MLEMIRSEYDWFMDAGFPDMYPKRPSDTAKPARCSCSTFTRSINGAPLALRGGGPCSRPPKFIAEDGTLYCAQHAKEPATVYRKATGALRRGLRPITAN